MADAAPKVAWPGGRRFAFTIFDDTDYQTVDNGRPIYDLLTELGFRTTKSVWTLAPDPPRPSAGATCADPGYAAWVRELLELGFEIGYHGASSDTSTRPRSEAGLARFEELFERTPRAYANHSGNREGMYWGESRLSGPRRRVYNFLTRYRRVGRFQGHDPSSPLFWGDLCAAKIDYVRDFVFDDVNTLRACPAMPYADPERPFVRRWFAGAEGATASAFLRTLSDANQDRLEREGGACIMYTHLASGFVEDGRVVPAVARAMRRLANKGGWFVPVSTLLDHIAAQRGVTTLRPSDRARLEWRWLASSVRIRAASGVFLPRALRRRVR